MKRKIYLAVTIDTECDKGKGWKVKQPLSFKNTREDVKSVLQPIFDGHGVKATYLLSPEVLMDQVSVDVFKGFGNKVELGTHLHAEFIEPYSDFTSDNTNHYQSDFDADTEQLKLKNLTELFVKQIGYSPASFRAGRFGISQNSLRFLAELGYKVDSSVTPDTQWKNSNGTKVNFFGAPYQPYYPCQKDYRKPGNLNILEAPVSMVNVKLAKLPNFLKRKIKLDNRFQHIAFNYLTGFSKPLWVRPTFSSFDEMQRSTEALIKHCHNEKVFLCMMFHSNEFSVNASPYSLTAEQVEVLIERLNLYFSWLMKSFSCVPIGLSEFEVMKSGKKID